MKFRFNTYFCVTGTNNQNLFKAMIFLRIFLLCHFSFLFISAIINVKTFFFFFSLFEQNEKDRLGGFCVVRNLTNRREKDRDKEKKIELPMTLFCHNDLNTFSYIQSSETGQIELLLYFLSMDRSFTIYNEYTDHFVAFVMLIT